MKSKRATYILYTSPGSYPVLGHGVRCLLADGWDVLVLGIRAKGTAAHLSLAAADNVQQKTLPPAPHGILQKLHYVYFAVWAFWHTFHWRTDVVYCIERLATPGALLSRVLLRKPVLFHEYDPPGQPRSLFERMLNLLRRSVAKRAVTCVIPNREREADFKRQLSPRSTLMVWNAVSTSEIKMERQNRIGQEPLCLWYQGSINAGQLPETLIDAVAIVPEARLKFVGFSSSAWQDYATRLMQRAKELRVADRVQYLGTPPTREALYEASAIGHVGLILFKIPFRDPMAGATQKAFEYMAAGMPLLVPNISEWQQFIVEPGFGRACDPGDPESIAEQIRWFVENPEPAREMGINGRKKVIEEWNYERLFQPVVETLNNCVSRIR